MPLSKEITEIFVTISEPNCEAQLSLEKFCRRGRIDISCLNSHLHKIVFRRGLGPSRCAREQPGSASRNWNV